jgi:hypothetical protein
VITARGDRSAAHQRDAEARHRTPAGVPVVDRSAVAGASSST